MRKLFLVVTLLSASTAVFAEPTPPQERAGTPEEQKAAGKKGLVVEQAGGAAAKAGVQPGDLIVGVGSTKVTTVDELRTQVDKAGKTAALLIERDGRQIYVPVKIS